MVQSSASRLLLSAAQIRQKVTRIAYEIYERNYNQNTLILAGVVDRGYRLAERLAQQLGEISPFSEENRRLTLVQVSLEKYTQQQAHISFNVPPENFSDQCVVLVDDVLNTGRTLAYCLPPILQYPVKKLEIAVLVNRRHSQFPVMASYTGLELATTLQEHIDVQFDSAEEGVYLR